jgi:hypothetical protein
MNDYKNYLALPMKLSKSNTIAIFIGSIATVIGAIAFFLGWYFWDFWGGPVPGYRYFLFPGNITLVYFWHPLFTEEVNFWPKLAMLLFGQFFVVTSFSASCIYMINKLKTRSHTMVKICDNHKI